MSQIVNGEKTRYRKQRQLKNHQKVLHFEMGEMPDVTRLSPENALKAIQGWMDKVKEMAIEREMYDILLIDITSPWSDYSSTQFWAVIGTVNLTREELARKAATKKKREDAAARRAEAKKKHELHQLHALAAKHPEAARAIARGKDS